MYVKSLQWLPSAQNYDECCSWMIQDSDSDSGLVANIRPESDWGQRMKVSQIWIKNIVRIKLWVAWQATVLAIASATLGVYYYYLSPICLLNIGMHLKKYWYQANEFPHLVIAVILKHTLIQTSQSMEFVFVVITVLYFISLNTFLWVYYLHKAWLKLLLYFFHILYFVHYNH